MKYRPELFRDDYNLDALQRVRPPGQQFEMLVTPRFTSHYGEQRFEPLTAALIRSVSRRKQVFLDVGAHYGFFTVLAGLESPELEIHALEPIPENMEILRRNLKLSGLSTVHCLEKAASDQVGQAPFHKSRAADNSSFHPHPDSPALDEIEVETLTLSTLLEQHAGASILVKIDTDGHEIPVLAGLETALSPSQDVTLIVELNPTMQRQAGYDPADLPAKLERMGFATFLVRDDDYRLLAVDSTTEWSRLIGPGGYANLYCRPAKTAINLCFVSHSHALAGAERSLAELVEQLVEYHGAVCNVVIPGEGALRERIQQAGAGVILAEYGWWCGDDQPTDEQIRERLGDDLARLLARTLPEIEKTRPDLICSNSMVIPYGAILASILDCPHIWNLHEYGGEQDGYRFFLPFAEVLEFVVGFSEFIFGATRALPGTLFPDLTEELFDFLYPHIRTPEILEPQRDPATISDSLQPLRLIELSSITAAKQQETDLRALAELVERGHDATLVLKGPQEPEYFALLRDLEKSLEIADRVTFEDFSEDIWQPLQAADVVVISAPTHSFGRTAAEGMLCGKVVIYPTGTGIEEYMEDGVTGLGYDASNHRQMADQIERLIVDPELRRRIGQAAYDRARQLFSQTGFADKFLDRARQVLAAEPASRPPLPRLLFESLLTGIERLGSETSELRFQLEARSEELAAVTTLASVREDEVGALKPTLLAREQELASLNLELETVREILAAREQELASIRSHLAAREDELGAVKPTLIAREEELAAVRSDYQASRNELAAIKPVLAARDKELESVKPILAARDKELESVKPFFAARDQELAALKPILQARDEELASLKPILAAKEEELAALKPILAARDEELAAARPILGTRAARITDLEKNLQHEAEQIKGLGTRLEMTEEILDRILATRIGRLALWIVRKK